MTERVISQSGKTVEVATMDDVTGEAADIPAATTTTNGTVKQAAAVAAVTDAPTADNFNALLTALKNSGIMANS